MVDVILKALQKGELSMQGQFLSGSNYTFLGSLAFDEVQIKVVYKPVRGEQPLWDFPSGSLAHREVAAFLLSHAMGWELVPPTLYRRKAPLGPGSLQLYIEHDPEYHFFSFTPEDVQRLRPAVIFDLITNNADRKAGHILRGQDGHLWLIDHGLCFNMEEKLRTVVWNFAGESIPDVLCADLERLDSLLKKDQPLRKLLERHLRPAEVTMLASRARRLRLSGRFPTPPESRRHYPWPPI